MKIIITHKVNKYLKKQSKGDMRGIDKIKQFLELYLAKAENPLTLPNCKKIVSYENLWRWRVGDYRIIAKATKENELIIKIIEIDKKDDNTYKGL